MLALVCALVLGGTTLASCPLSVTCPHDGLLAFYAGTTYDWKCLCIYRHRFGNKVHELVLACE